MGGELVETRAGFSRDTSIRVYAVGARHQCDLVASS
jgi:hypothetical protein